jgi:hypothetical protein
MIITDKFVYIHLSKTGGTFVTQVLKQIHEARGDKIVACYADKQPKSRWSLRQLINPRRTFLMLQHWDDGLKTYNQHGKANDIPPGHQHKPILTTIRNPYDHYVSGYEFRWWAFPREASSTIGQWLYGTYPHFPDLSFAEYLHMTNGLALINRFGSINGHPRFSSEDMHGSSFTIILTTLRCSTPLTHNILTKGVIAQIFVRMLCFSI